MVRGWRGKLLVVPRICAGDTASGRRQVEEVHGSILRGRILAGQAATLAARASSARVSQMQQVTGEKETREQTALPLRISRGLARTGLAGVGDTPGSRGRVDTSSFGSVLLENDSNDGASANQPWRTPWYISMVAVSCRRPG